MKRSSLVLVAVLAGWMPLQGQEKSAAAGSTGVYKIELVVHDGTDAAAKAGRRFTMMVDDSYRGTFHIGGRVPVVTGSGGAMGSTQWTYMDTGVNIDCTVHEVGSRVALRGSLDMSTFVKTEPETPAANPPGPTIRQTKVDLEATLDIGKPSVVASVDDPETSRKLQVEVTVSRAN